MTSGKKGSLLTEASGVVFSIILSVIFLYIAFQGIDTDSFLHAFDNVNYFYVVLFALSILSAHYIRAIRWKVMLKSVKPDVSVHHSFGAIMIGYGVNNAIPRLGEVSRAILLGQYEQISRSSILGSIVLERIIDIILFGLAVLLAGILYEGNLYQSFPWLKTTFFFGIIFMAGLITIVVLSVKYRERFYTTVIKFIQKFSPTLAKNLGIIFEKMIIGFNCLQSTSAFVSVLVLSALIMINYGVNSYIGFLMLDMQKIVPVNLTMAWVVMSIGGIGVMIPTPGGIGSYHSITKAVLTLLYPFPSGISVAYAVLTHGISYVIHSVVAAFYFLMFRIRYKNVPGKSLLKFEEVPTE